MFAVVDVMQVAILAICFAPKVLIARDVDELRYLYISSTGDDARLWHHCFNDEVPHRVPVDLPFLAALHSLPRYLETRASFRSKTM